MNKNRWLLTMAGVGLLLPGIAQALGLGTLQVLSAPGEPFRAEIPLQSLNPKGEANLSVGLASARDFAMIDLPRSGALDHWHFTVRSGDRPAVLISSPLPLDQPELHFLVQLDWSGGQMVREYTASGIGNNVVPVAAPPASVPQSVASPTTPRPARHTTAAPLYHGWARVSRYGPVPVNGSLFQAAQSIVNSNAVTIDQVMAALLKANPQAFKGGNPDYLYAGTMLTVPSLAQVQSASPAQASAWLSARKAVNKLSVVAVATAPTASAAATSAAPVSASAVSAATAAKPVGNATHLVLSSAPAAAVTAPVASGASPASLLQNSDAMLRKDNQKLTAEVAGLGQRLSAEERLLANQGAQLAALSRAEGNNNLPLILSLGGNLLLLALFIWMWRRQKEAEQRQREISQRVSVLSTAPKAPAAPPQSGTPTPVTAATAPAPAAVVPAGARAAAPASAAPSADHAISAGVPHAGAAEIDPVEQADLYLTYGKAEQAVAVLNDALEENPRRKELYVKLLDIYANLDRHAEYLDLAERMRGRFGPNNGAWQEVAAQGARLFPGNPLFAISDEGAVVASVPVVGVDQPAPGEASPALVPPDVLDFHFDHTSAEPAAGEALNAFPAAEKARLLQDIDEQFRLMEAAEAETGAPGPQAKSVLELAPDVSAPAPAPAAESPAGGAPSDSPGVADWDAMGTKLDLAKAYVEMGDGESARDLLEELIREDSGAHQEEARQLLRSL
ncbi:Motility protein FimV [Acidithiobacillus sp. 'AMD consortium']|uniref:FimV/HubP family polar landmark protein n=1 Tax=Acidithiobacillus sp. 'AMD consortium' TaxID=2614801 RepID=UPI00124DD7A9|nr:FimV/HubP family polar landmark protein [Acidithiobacillus sp. 'AMD consortium']QFG78754.1 Motility protein FimV [Acidithiobacillus sp. 'AMD consortium']